MARMTGAGLLSLVQHFEQVLGPVRTGWLTGPVGERLPFQVVRYASGPDVGSVAYSTLGLSRMAPSGAGGAGARQELLVLTTKSLPVEYVLGMLRDVGAAIIARGQPLAQGEVLGPIDVPLHNSQMAAVYAAMPVYFADEFATHVTADGTPIEVLWLVPITAPEAAFVRASGWEAFEDLLAAQDPDLVDVYRPEITLAPASLAPSRTS